MIKIFESLLLYFFFLTVPLINYEGLSTAHSLFAVFLIVYLISTCANIGRDSLFFNSVLIFYIPSIFIQIIYVIIDTDSLQKEHQIVYGVLVYSLLGHLVGRVKLISFNSAILISGFGFAMIFYYTIFTFDFVVVGGRLESKLISLNFIGTIYFVVFFITLYEFLKNNKILQLVIIGVPSIAYLIVQGARKELIAIVICSFWAIYIYKKINVEISKIRLYSVYLIIALLLFGFIYFIFERYSDIDVSLWNVFFANNDDRSSYARKLEYEAALKFILEYPFGLGLGNVRIALNSIPELFDTFAGTQHADNFWVESVYMYGILGPFLLLFMICNLFTLFYRVGNKIDYYIPLVIFLNTFFVNYSHYKVLFCMLCFFETSYMNKSKLKGLN